VAERFAAVECLNTQEDFWARGFSGRGAGARNATDHPRPAVLDDRGDGAHFQLDAEVTQSLRRLCAQHGVTMHTLMMAAFSVLLARYTGQQDVVIGNARGRTPPTPRSRASSGMFVNTLPIRTAPTDGRTFLDFMSDMKERLLAAFDHQEYPLDLLVERLKLRRDPSRTTLDDVCLVLQDAEAWHHGGGRSEGGGGLSNFLTPAKVRPAAGDRRASRRFSI